LITGHWSSVSGSAGRQSVHEVELNSAAADHVNDSAVSLSSNSAVDR